MLSYVAEPNESQRFIAFLQTTEPTSDNPKNLVRTLDDPNWVAIDTPKGREIIQEPFKLNEQGQLPAHLLAKVTAF